MIYSDTIGTGDVMRKVVRSNNSKPVQWVSMRHEADCWIAASAMSAGVSYEEAEEVFGSGADYSAQLLGERDEPSERRLTKMFLFLHQWAFFGDHGYYALFLPGIDPPLKPGRRYLLSASTAEPGRPWMAHTIVDEAGKLFDPDPNYNPSN